MREVVSGKRKKEMEISVLSNRVSVGLLHSAASVIFIVNLNCRS